jgi:hypothetical protein
MICAPAIRQDPVSVLGSFPSGQWRSRTLSRLIPRRRTTFTSLGTALAPLWIAALTLVGDPLAVLRESAELTPVHLIRHFADFTFELGDQLQPPERFLERKQGDCDDFASLASTLLTERGYHAKLVVVVMATESHVVCYVAEIKGFLDFNFRSRENPIVTSENSLEDIAKQVSATFQTDWVTASEFVYRNGSRYFLDTVFR